MKSRPILIVLFCLMALVSFGRILDTRSISQLVKDSKLAFVGRVKTIKPSGITTPLSYPTWESVTFSWLKLDVEVLEPLKGVRKGDVVQIAVLSVGGRSGPVPLVNAPGTLKPKTGDLFLFFLGPTPVTNLFAALTAPYDDNQSIFLLDRNNPAYAFVSQARKDRREDLGVFGERYDVIQSLIGDSKELLPAGVETLRKNYAKEIETASSNNMIYLEWVSYTNAHGWSSDVPKGSVFTNSAGIVELKTNSAN